MPAQVLKVDFESTLLRSLKLSGHLGIDALPNQLVHKRIQQGFVFNIMCIGEPGLGKSTLMDTLFNTSFNSVPCAQTLPNVKLQERSYELQERSVHLKLTICDTVSYGAQINKEHSFQAVIDYINGQFVTFLQEELKIKRVPTTTCHDGRIHACLYFICPTGHGLKSLDLVCMKLIHEKVNIIPVIAKADTISKAELQHFKTNIMQELHKYGVQIYQSPTSAKSAAKVNTSTNEQLPFAVVGSTDFIQVGSRMLRVRQYPWGTVHVENELHCDFIKLREMLIRNNMEDLREQTHSRHYELFRRNRLREMGFSDVDGENMPTSFQEILKVKLINHLMDLQAREDEVREMFVQRVHQKESELKEHENELHAKFDQLKRNYAEEKQNLEMRKKELENDWEDFKLCKIQFVTCLNQVRTLGKQKKNA